MGNEKIRTAVIGLGGLAQNIHLPNLAELPQAEAVALCDLNPAVLDRRRQEYPGLHYYLSYHEMLEKENLQAVLVLVQPDALYRVTADCLNAGLHVFMEKPMGITEFQSRALAKKALQNHCYLQVGFNRRFIPLVQKTVELVRQNTEINLVTGCFYKNSGAEFYDSCASSFECDVVHCIDLVRHIAGSEAAAASLTEIQTPDSAVPNLWNGAVRFRSGVLGTVSADYSSGARVHQFEIHGKNVSAYLNLGFGDAVCNAVIFMTEGHGPVSLSSRGAAQEQIIRLDGIQEAGSPLYRKYYGYYAELEAFFKALLAGKTAADAHLEEALETSRIVSMLRQNRI